MSFGARSKRGRPAWKTAATLISQIPHFLRLLYRLMRDPRVSLLDRALVLGTIAYVVTPTDLLPDFLVFLGLVDDLYLLALVLDRLFVRAGETVLLQSWDGDARVLRSLIEGLDEIGSFVPAPVRALLRGRLPQR